MFKCFYCTLINQPVPNAHDPSHTLIIKHSKLIFYGRIKISAADINKLRQMTGAGMMDCKKALEESDGDYEAAQDYLRKKGIAKAAKREDREAKEGVVVARTTPTRPKASSWPSTARPTSWPATTTSLP